MPAAASIAVSAEIAADGVDLALHASPLQAPGAGDALAIAGFVVERDGGRLWCASSGNRVVIRLPGR